MSDQNSRLQAALELVTAAMNSPNAFENSKESTFSALRRGCLDLRKSLELLDSDEFSSDKIRDAWLFLIELSRAKLRRKHALECINIMLLSPKWGAVLRNDETIQGKIPSLSKDMQMALGYQTSPSISPSPVPSTAAIAPSALVRKPSMIARSKSGLKPKRAVSIKGSQSPPVLPREPSIDDAKPIESIPEPISIPSKPLVENPPVLAETQNDSNKETNPFKLDLNPFKDFRGLKQTSNPYAVKARGPAWWDQATRTSQSSAWWK
jgi:hypothetical protein